MVTNALVYWKTIGDKCVSVLENHICLSPFQLLTYMMLKTLGEATGGYIGLMDMILRETAIRALKKGLQKIDLETFKEVAAEYK
ncbi:hypothetical protein [uncultured Nostoc sp.]|uniref:hypothetical protein n=1 Tax=uncultured Nostoc sp. TaxID=340711 RepID=UPI0035CC4FB2